MCVCVCKTKGMLIDLRRNVIVPDCVVIKESRSREWRHTSILGLCLIKVYAGKKNQHHCQKSTHSIILFKEIKIV